MIRWKVYSLMKDTKKAAAKNSDFIKFKCSILKVFSQHIIIGGWLGFACSFTSAIIRWSIFFTAELAIFDLILLLAISSPISAANAPYLFAALVSTWWSSLLVSRISFWEMSLFISCTSTPELASYPRALFDE